jgi:hypothetical protein
MHSLGLEMLGAMPLAHAVAPLQIRGILSYFYGRDEINPLSPTQLRS